MTSRASLAGLALLAACAIAGWRHPPTLAAAWLAAWWFWSGIVLGAAALQRIHVLTGGRWGRLLGPPTRALQRSTPWLLGLAVPLLAAGSLLYPWLHGSVGPVGPESDVVRGWFAPAAVLARLAVYAVASLASAWTLRRTESTRSAVLGLAGYLVLGSLATVDLVMSLQAGWTSSVFGWLVLSGQLTSGLCAVLCGICGRLCPAPAAPGGHPGAPLTRDLGNLLLAWVLLQGYLQFMQFLIIWAANLPREIVWYLPRLNGGWGGVALVLVALQLALPAVALLWRRVKDDARVLRTLAAAVLAGQGLGTVWLVLPSVPSERMLSVEALLLVLLAFAGMGLLVHGTSAAVGAARRGRADAARPLQPIGALGPRSTGEAR